MAHPEAGLDIVSVIIENAFTLVDYMVVVLEVEFALCQVATTSHLGLLANFSFRQVRIKSYLVNCREVFGASFLVILRLVQVVSF